jgi:hypothetical protein
MSRAGLSRLWVPRSLGGAEADIATVVQVVEAVSRIDGAAGWCLAIAGNTSLPGYLPSRAARDIFASDPLLVTAGSWAPFGQAVARRSHRIPCALAVNLHALLSCRGRHRGSSRRAGVLDPD